MAGMCENGQERWGTLTPAAHFPFTLGMQWIAFSHV
jgi:hypothetical protein